MSTVDVIKVGVSIKSRSFAPILIRGYIIYLSIFGRDPRMFFFNLVVKLGFKIEVK